MKTNWNNSPIGRFLTAEVASYLRYEDRTPSDEELALSVFDHFAMLASLDDARDEVKAARIEPIASEER